METTKKRRSSFATSVAFEQKKVVPKFKRTRSASDQWIQVGQKVQEMRRRIKSTGNDETEAMVLRTKVLEENKIKLEREKLELKGKIDELQQYKEKYEEQIQENKSLRNKMDEMYHNQNDAGKKLVKSNESLEKLRLEHKKMSEQLEKNHKDMRTMEDRMRNLEIRASDAEKTALILETTKQNLDSANQQIRVRESEIYRLNKIHEETCNQLELSNHKMSDMEEKLRDLKNQVRHEIMKNENIEKNLETIPKMKAELEDKHKELQVARKALEEKTALLAAARKSAREYRDKCRVLDRQATKTDMLEHELEISKCEVHTLKKLMQGKDGLIIQKTKALDVAKEIIQSMKQSKSRDQVDKIVVLLEKICNSQNYHTLSACESVTTSGVFDSDKSHSVIQEQHCNHKNKHDVNHDITVNRVPYPSDSEQPPQPPYRKRPVSSSVFSEQILNDFHGSCDDIRPQTAIVKPTIKRSASSKSASFLSKSSRQHSGSSSGNNSRNYDVTERSLSSRNHSDEFRSPRVTTTPAWTCTTKSEPSVFTDSCSVSSDDAIRVEMSPDCLLKLQKLSLREKEDILKSVIETGSRVLVSVAQKPPRYGKKIIPKPKIFTGIVKYLGTLDKQSFDARTYVGMRLDDTMGDTDGMVRGHRFMYTPFDQGKFFKLLDVTCVLDVQTGKYSPISTIFMNYAAENL